MNVRRVSHDGTLTDVVEIQSTVGASDNMTKKLRPVIYAVYGVLIIMGIGTGYMLSRTVDAPGLEPTKTSYVKSETGAGVSDTKSFRDSAEGVIEKGGVDGEGTHKLIRDGGPSQTAFLVSSVVDLDEYVAKKVKVYGETFAAKKAAWLMDVGKIEILQ